MDVLEKLLILQARLTSPRSGPKRPLPQGCPRRGPCAQAGPNRPSRGRQLGDSPTPSGGTVWPPARLPEVTQGTNPCALACEAAAPKTRTTAVLWAPAGGGEPGRSRRGDPEAAVLCAADRRPHVLT